MRITTPYEDGSPDSLIGIIAEAPAREEMLRGRPLVGKSGRVFEEILTKARIPRFETYIGNVSRKPISSIAKLVSTGKNHVLTKQGKEEVELLRERLEKTKCEIFVPMGNLALFALTGKWGITAMRGSPLPCTLIPGRWVIPTLHPASTLIGRGPFVWRYLIEADFKKAMRHASLSREGKPHIPERDLIIDPSFPEVIDYLRSIQATKEGRVSYDLETYNNNVSCFSITDKVDYCMSIPMLDTDSPGWSRWSREQEIQIWLLFSSILGDPEIDVVGQNHIGFDNVFLFEQNNIRVRGKQWDLHLAHKLVYPDFSGKLEFIQSIRTDEPYYKDDRKLWKRPAKDPHTFWRYNAKDSIVTLDAWDDLWPELQDYMPEYLRTVAPGELCLFMTSRGFRVDIEGLSHVRKTLGEELAAREAQLKACARVPFNPHSSQQVISYFYDTLGLTAYVNRRKKSDGTYVSTPTCDDKALSRIVRKHNLKEARLLQEIRALAKLKGTYVDLSLDEDNRLRSSYDLRGTVSGRFSSKKTIRGTGLNAQNIHPKFKPFITAEVSDEV